MQLKVLLLLLLSSSSIFSAAKTNKRSLGAKPSPKQKPKARAQTSLSAKEKEKDDQYFLDYKPKQNIIYANSAMLKDLKSEFQYVVVLFSSPSCAICPELLIDYRKLARQMYQDKILIPFVFFECDPFDNYCHSKERIADTPSLRIYHKNSFIQFKGGKKRSEYFNWIYDRMVSSFVKLTEPDGTVQALVKEGEVVILFFGDEGYPLFSEFKLLTIMYEFGHFFIAKEEEVKAKALSNCKEKIDEQKNSLIVVINPDNKKCYFYNEGFNYKKIINFIYDHDKIPVAQFDHNALYLQERYQIPIMLFFSFEGENDPFFQNYKTIAERHKRKMSFTFVDKEMLGNDLVRSTMEVLGVDRRQFPCVRIFLKNTRNENLKWKPSGLLEPRKLEAFIRKVLGHKIRPYKKTESLKSLARENERGMVEKISRANFSKKIEEETSPVLLVIEGSKELCPTCEGIEAKILEVKQKILQRVGQFPYKMFRLNIQLNEIDNWIFDNAPEIILIKQNKDIRHFYKEFEENKIIEFLEENIKEDSKDLFDNSNL